MKKILLSFILALVAVSSWAYDVKIDGIYYNLVSKTKMAEVTSGDSVYAGTVLIPSSIYHEGVSYSVTSIGDKAFSDSRTLISISIPNSVTNIGVEAFYNCSNLTSINIPSSVEIINDEAFYGCKNLETVTCYATKVPLTYSNTFKDAYIEYATLVVPEEVLEEYKSTTPWSDFGTFKTVEEVETNVKTISANATPLLISQNAGIVTVFGIQDGNVITAYSIEGEKVASAVVDGTSATLDLNKLQGSVVVLTVGGKSAKVFIK